MAVKKKLGRPALTPHYCKIIESVPKGEIVQVGMYPSNEPFESHQAAAYHRDNIQRKLRVKSVVEVVTVDDAIEDSEYMPEDGRFWTTTRRGYFLLLHGRAKAGEGVVLKDGAVESCPVPA